LGKRRRLVTLRTAPLTKVIILRKQRDLETIAVHYTVPAVNQLS
jgi:hypothetical protein